MLHDPRQIDAMRSMWTGVIRTAILDDWIAARKADAATVDAMRRYYETSWFRRVCEFSGIEHSEHLVSAIMRVIAGPKRPVFSVAGTADERVEQ